MPKMSAKREFPGEVIRRVRLTFLITLVSVALSLCSYGFATILMGGEFAAYGWAVAAMVPCIVAPAVSWVTTGLIVRLRNANLELARVQAKFEQQSMRQKDVFRRLSHELRTPAAAIHMIAGAPTAYAESRLKVQDAAGTLLHFLDAIQSAINAREEVTDVTETFTLARLRDDLNFLGQAISSDGSARFSVEVTWDKALDGLTLEADYLRLRGCVMNLVRNALLHAQATSVIVEIGAEALDDGARATIAVRDDGVGIPADKIGTILQPYQRGETAAKGTGLGLAIVQDWLRGFDSKLEITSEPGRGSRFGFVADLGAPQAQKPSTVEVAPPAPVPEPPQHHSDGASSMSVLLVEDHAITREIGQTLLARVFGKVEVAANPSEALEFVRNGGFDLLVTDYMMPEMTGAELISAAFSAGYRGVAVGLTAALDPQVVGEFNKAGCKTILLKPLRPNSLLSAVVPEAACQKTA